MNKRLRDFLKDYPGVAKGDYTVHVYTEDMRFFRHIKNETFVFKESTISFKRHDDGNIIRVKMPMGQVGEFLHGLELYKMGQVNDE